MLEWKQCTIWDFKAISFLVNSECLRHFVHSSFLSRWCPSERWKTHDADRPTKNPLQIKINNSLKKGHSLGTASMCWSPPSAGSKRDAGRHQPSRGDVTWVLGDISYNDFFMGHHGRSSPSPTTLILQSKATSCPSNCSSSQGEITTEDWLWLSWTVFLGGRGSKRYTEMRKIERGIALSLLSFLGDACLLKIYLSPLSPSCSFLLQRWSEAWQERLPTQKEEQQGKWESVGDHSATAIGAAPHPDACI